MQKTPLKGPSTLPLRYYATDGNYGLRITAFYRVLSQTCFIARRIYLFIILSLNSHSIHQIRKVQLRLLTVF